MRRDPIEPFLSERRARLAALDATLRRERQRRRTASWNASLIWLAIVLVMLAACWSLAR